MSTLRYSDANAFVLGVTATPDRSDKRALSAYYENVAFEITLLDHIRELLSLHWNKAKDAADEDGRFSIGLRISVSDGAPTRLKVKCRINKTITDEVESTVEDPGQMKLL
jgi:hypothetical protein